MNLRPYHRLLLLLPAVILAATPPAAALNGHFVHGSGARNTAMGGAGAALPSADPLVALTWNPALLTAIDGDEVQVSMELIKGSPEISSTVQTPFGPLSGTTEDDTGVLPIPATAWARHEPGSRWGVGFGAISMAGFFTDYPQDSSNPILAPQPQGFGRVNSEYQYLKIPLGFAYQVTPELSLGAALTLGYSRLSAAPAAFAAPDCTGPTTCFFPVANQEGAWGGGVQVGLHWRPAAAWSFAAAYSTEQSFEDFEFNSAVSNPGLPTFGTDRSFEFSVDVPEIATVAAAWSPSPDLDLALDVRWFGYDGVDGLGTAGFNRDGSIRGFGWDDIVVVAVGGEWRTGPRWALRAGYNLAESPIDEDLVTLSSPAPATFEDHVNLGVGYTVGSRLRLDLTYWHGFENDVTGPLLGAGGPIPGTEVSQSNEADAVSTTLSFTF